MIRVFLMLLASGCGDVTVHRPVTDVVPEDEAWDTVRAGVIKPRHCYRGWREYCPDDPELIDALVEAMLIRHFDGVMPESRRAIDELTNLAAMQYARYVRSDGRSESEEKIRRYYQEPAVEIVEGKGVSVRVGVPPGRLSLPGAQPTAETPMVMKSPFVRDGEWDTHEIARFLKHYRSAYPEQPAIRLQVLVPDEAEVRRVDVRWYVELDRIVIADMETPTEGFVTEPLHRDLTPYLEGRRSLHTKHLKPCALDRAGRPRCVR